MKQMRSMPFIKSARSSSLTSSFHKRIVQGIRQQRIRQHSEVRLQNRSDAADIVETVVVPQIERSVVATLEELRDDLRLSRAASLAVDTLVVESYTYEIRPVINIERRHRDGERMQGQSGAQN